MTIRRWGDRSRSSVTGENVGGGADHDSLERDASATIGHTKKKRGAYLALLALASWNS